MGPEPVLRLGKSTSGPRVCAHRGELVWMRDDTGLCLQVCLLPPALRRAAEEGRRAEVCGSAIQHALLQRSESPVTARRPTVLQQRAQRSSAGSNSMPHLLLRL